MGSVPAAFDTDYMQAAGSVPDPRGSVLAREFGRGNVALPLAGC